MAKAVQRRPVDGEELMEKGQVLSCGRDEVGALVATTTIEDPGVMHKGEGNLREDFHQHLRPRTSQSRDQHPSSQFNTEATDTSGSVVCNKRGAMEA